MTTFKFCSVWIWRFYYFRTTFVDGRRLNAAIQLCNFSLDRKCSNTQKFINVFFRPLILSYKFYRHSCFTPNSFSISASFIFKFCIFYMYLYSYDKWVRGMHLCKLSAMLYAVDCVLVNSARSRAIFDMRGNACCHRPCTSALNSRARYSERSWPTIVEIEVSIEFWISQSMLWRSGCNYCNA